MNVHDPNLTTAQAKVNEGLFHPLGIFFVGEFICRSIYYNICLYYR
jgi:hypothetical protein